MCQGKWSPYRHTCLSCYATNNWLLPTQASVQLLRLDWRFWQIARRQCHPERQDWLRRGGFATGVARAWRWRIPALSVRIVGPREREGIQGVASPVDHQCSGQACRYREAVATWNVFTCDDLLPFRNSLSLLIAWLIFSSALGLAKPDAILILAVLAGSSPNRPSAPHCLLRKPMNRS